MIVTKKALARRTMLRGMGAGLALPLLDAMVPALSAMADTPAKLTRRFSLVYVPNGINMAQWTPQTEGMQFELPPTLAPLSAFRDHLLVLTGLNNDEVARPLPGEFGPHARAGGAFLTGTHPKKTEGPDVRAGVSFDQMVAMAIGKETQLRSLELAIEPTELAGTCDAGYSCTYVNTLSWATPTLPLPTENHPRAVFERLFGDGSTTDAKARRQRLAADRSILDSVSETVASLTRGLGPSDRTKLTQYLDSIREVESRIQRAETQAVTLPAVDRPAGIPASYEEHVKLMFDLQVLAHQVDLTRVITFMMAREVSQRSYPEIGVTGAHHSLSHHGGRAESIADLVKINAYHANLVKYYVEKLDATPNGDGSLLDQTVVLYAAGISEGNSHSYDNLPIALIGGKAAGLKSGRHVRYPTETPLANLWVSLMDKLGVHGVDHFGNSTAAVEHLSDV